MLNRIGLITLVFLLASPRGSQAQPGPRSPILEVEQAAAGYLPTLFPDQRIGLDAAPFSYYEKNPTEQARRTSGHLTLLAGVARAELVVESEARFCVSDPGPGCIGALLRIGVPEVSGDTATVWLYARRRWRHPENQAADVRTSHSDTQLLVLRADGRWRVVRVLQERVE